MIFASPSTNRRAFGTFASLSVVGLALSGANCSSKGAGAGGEAECASTPTECPQGQTCWPTSATTLGCIASEPAAVAGATCTEQYNQATCGDGMLCDSTSPTGTGQCALYCGPTSACPAGYSCNTTQVGASGPMVDICRLAAQSTSDDGGQPGQTVDAAGLLPDISYIPETSVDSSQARQ